MINWTDSETAAMEAVTDAAMLAGGARNRTEWIEAGEAYGEAISKLIPAVEAAAGLKKRLLSNGLRHAKRGAAKAGEALKYV